jgi:hypothetical protein
MTTPTREQIRKKAEQIFMREQQKGFDAISDSLPEYGEIKESGFIDVARLDLMNSPEKEYEELFKSYSRRSENLADFAIDVSDALKSGVYCSGTTGTGKSDLGMYTAKALMEKGVNVVAFDSTQDWQTRSSIAQFETLRFPYINEIPETSTVFDISLLSVLQRQRLIEGFCGGIYRYQAMKKPSERRQYFLVFEEAHNYFKEGFMRSKCFSDSAMLLSEGRNYNVRFMCITQFASLLDKTAMKYMRLRFFGYSSEPNDVEYIARFFPKEDRDGIKKTLQKLCDGQFLTMNGQTIAIQPFKSDVEKKQIATEIIPKTESLQTTQLSRQNDYTLAKTAVVGFLALIFLWSMIH